MESKLVPRIDGVGLKHETCPACGKMTLVDVHEAFGLPHSGWKMCSCGYQVQEQ